jgi:hypothetical protein
MAVLAALDVLNGVTNGVAAACRSRVSFVLLGGLTNGDGRAPLLDGVVSWLGAARPPFRSPHTRPSWCWLTLTAVATATTA